ncbi:MAG: sugar phosphate isomerase/epimerase [Fimbriimonadales bacterium]|jgi:sugar phosphate isomerase/epimerase|nr:sugar phosphate isomerase/epimerase [Fimbriimonadales bacterium]
MIRTPLNRREFLVGAFALVPAAKVLALNANHVARPWFEISLAEWSLHRTIFSGKMTNLDFPRVAKQDFGIDAIEYVNQFFKDKANDKSYLKDLKDRCKSEGVKSVLIMCDGEGATGDPDQAARMKAVENHYKWVDAARFLGCHSIRVNAYSKGTPEEQARLCADGLAKLGEYATKQNINVIVENHGGLSSRGDWLTGVMQKVNMKNVGTLPDFGNFYEYDRYKGVEEMMPFAKGVSAKTHDFGPYGDELFVDYTRLLGIVKAAGYRGRIGIEFEGDRVSEADGIRLTKALLERVRGDKA